MWSSGKWILPCSRGSPKETYMPKSDAGLWHKSPDPIRCRSRRVKVLKKSRYRCRCLREKSDKSRLNRSARRKLLPKRPRGYSENARIGSDARAGATKNEKGRGPEAARGTETPEKRGSLRRRSDEVSRSAQRVRRWRERLVACRPAGVRRRS